VLTVQDTIAPTVLDVLVRGTGWNSAVDSYSLVNGISPELPLSWFNLDQVIVVFSEPVATPANDSIKLTRTTNVVPLMPTGVVPGVAPNSWVWTFALDLTTDKYRLVVAGESGDTSPIADPSGNLLLDGTDYSKLFGVVQGDADRNGETTVNDLVNVSANVGNESTTPDPEDVDGSGEVTVTDLVNISALVGQELPGGTPPLNLRATRMGNGVRRTTVTSNQLDPILDSAVDRWIESGLSAAEANILRNNVTIVIADLDGTQLAQAHGMTITVDQDAAGWGWFVDRTPNDNREFQRARQIDELFGNQFSKINTRMDLSTVIMHELGHLIGHDDDTSYGELMHETLEPGVRRLPHDAVFADASADIFADSLVNQVTKSTFGLRRK
jgi:hypothetical protein